jgi:small subunit ribosomal protein S5
MVKKKNPEKTKTTKKEEVKKPEKEEIPEKKEEVEEETMEAPTVEVTEEGKEELVEWKPRTSLGKAVMRGEITDINKILEEGIKIREPQIVDILIPNLESELVFIGGRPGKGGGIQRTPIRISAKMHRSGRRYTSTAFAIVGNKDGIVGIGKGRGKEGREAIRKAIEKAKLNLIKVPRGCGSWECECGEPHSIPFKTKGKSGSVRVTLMPAPKGIGLAVDDESKKILRLAGINDVWGKTLGDTGTRFNLIKAVFNALKNLHRYKTG